MINFISSFLYTLFIQLLFMGFKLASPFNNKAKKWIEGRKESNLKFNKRDYSKKLIWFHVSSVGEYEQGLPVLNALKKKYTNYQFAISFFSPSGYELINKKNKEDFIFYFPLDTLKNAKLIYKNLRPDVLFLVKYDYWYVILNFLLQKKLKIYVISAKFTPQHLVFKFYGKWFYSILKKLTHFFVQDQVSENLLKSRGISQVTFSGDTRFDRVKELINEPHHLAFLEQFKGDSSLLVAGSTWKKDDELLQNLSLPVQLKLVIVPHEIKKTYCFELQQKFKNAILYSEIKDKNIKEFSVLIIDTVGLLTKIYAYSDFAYVGGAFDKDGVHNVLEPAVFGVPVFFGTNIKKYEEAKNLVKSKGGILINNTLELQIQLDFLLQNPKEKQKTGNYSKDFIFSQPNAVEVIMERVDL
jgi:3-deoxy-D-manno-octulosonic-acid transferase